MNALRAVLRVVRDGWLILGMILLLLAAAESFLRVKGAIGHAWMASRRSAEVPNPLEASDWYEDYLREFKGSQQMRWAPYVYFRRPPYRGRYITVDSLGHRVTPQSRTESADKVFFFGGSTMWGSYQRDEHTIPAEAARRAAALGLARPVAITNFGESGYVFTQELVELVLQLRAGNIPDLVVFYDGINDVGSTVQDGAAGVPANESNRIAEFAIGRTLRPSTSGLGPDLRALAALGALGLEKTELTRSLKSLVRPAASPLIPVDSAVHDLLRIYTGNVRVIEALARSFGFRVLYVWQPSLQATQKQLTPFERQLMVGIEGSPFQQRLRAVHAAVPPLLDSAMATLAPGRFVDASDLFAGDTLSVFVDQIGHTTEQAIPRIEDVFWPVLAGMLAAPPLLRGASGVARSPSSSARSVGTH